MKRFLPLFILLGIAVLTGGGWLIFGNRVMTAYYTGALERALEEGRDNVAADAAERLTALEPRNPEFRRKASEALSSIGSYARAEYHLKEAIALGGSKQASFYLLLSGLYARQDKLLDAVALLDGAKGLSSGEVASMRPEAPVPEPQPGRFEQPAALAFSVPEGCMCYYSLTREYPSLQSPYTGPVELPPGETTVSAVTVDARGVASPLFTGVYTKQGED